MAPGGADLNRLLELAGDSVCWGVVVFVWVAGAAYNAAHATGERTRGRTGTAAPLGAIAVCAIVVLVSRRSWQGLVVGGWWIQIVGIVVVVTSTAFAVWARLSLGSMWSVVPVIQGEHRLHTDGPYAVTRNPIYTGLLGMLLGTTLLGGIGHLLLLFPVGVVVLEVKILAEERLLAATFPAEYPQYRRRVPQLVPGFFALRHRNATGS